MVIYYDSSYLLLVFLYPDVWLESVSAVFIFNPTCRIVELKLNYGKVDLN